MITTFILSGIPAPKKNSRRIFVDRNDKIQNLPSQAHENWHATAYSELLRQSKVFRGRIPVASHHIEIRYFVYDKRKRDLTNVTDSVMDLLVDANILVDDNMQEVPHLTMIYRGKVRTKGEARTEVDVHT